MKQMIECNENAKAAPERTTKEVALKARLSTSGYIIIEAVDPDTQETLFKVFYVDKDGINRYSPTFRRVNGHTVFRTDTTDYRIPYSFVRSVGAQNTDGEPFRALMSIYA